MILPQPNDKKKCGKRNASAPCGVFLLAAALLFLAAEVSFVRAAAQKKNAPAPGPGILVPDKGRLKILLDGKPAGSEDFEIAPDGANWRAKGTTEIRLPEVGSSRVSSQFKLRPDGSPLSYEWSSQGEKKASALVAFEGGVARIQLEMEGSKPFVQELNFGAPAVAVLDNNVYHHYAILARLYDWNRKGAQTFPVLIPQDMTPGSITVESTGAQSADGKSYEGLRVSTADLEVLLYLDAGHRLMRLEVPASKVVVFRE